MEGFRPEPTVHSLVFKGTRLDGLVVDVEGCSISEYNNLVLHLEKMSKTNADNVTAADAIEAGRWMTRMFVQKLVDWNLLHPKTGEEVPKTLEGLESLDSDIFAALVAAWQKSMVTLPAPLSEDSNDGEPPVTPSDEMEDSLSSQTNWPTPS